MALKYETLLDLARQRLDDIAGSPNKTREARETALKLKAEIEARLRRVAEIKAAPYRSIFDDAA